MGRWLVCILENTLAVLHLFVLMAKFLWHWVQDMMTYEALRLLQSLWPTLFVIIHKLLCFRLLKLLWEIRWFTHKIVKGHNELYFAKTLLMRWWVNMKYRSFLDFPLFQKFSTVNKVKSSFLDDFSVTLTKFYYYRFDCFWIIQKIEKFKSIIRKIQNHFQCYSFLWITDEIWSPRNINVFRRNTIVFSKMVL